MKRNVNGMWVRSSRTNRIFFLWYDAKCVEYMEMVTHHRHHHQHHHWMDRGRGNLLNMPHDQHLLSCLSFFPLKMFERKRGIKWTRDELKHQSIYPLLLLLLLSISAAARAHLLTNTHYGCCTRPRTSLLKYKKKSKLHSSFLSLQSQLYIAPLSVIHYSSSLLRSLIFCRLFIGNHLWV